MKVSKSQLKKFWESVNKQGPIHPVLKTRCWEWIGAKFSNDYGQFSQKGVHRISWEITNGAIPEGLFVLHKCDNRPCVNPNHLFLGTHQDNMDDCIQKGRNAVGDRNGARLYPERIIRGESHYSRTNPELMSRGEAHSKVMLIHSPKGEAVYNAILTDDIVRWCRKRYAEGGISITQISAMFGISRMPMWQAIRGQTWKHVK